MEFADMRRERRTYVKECLARHLCPTPLEVPLFPTQQAAAAYEWVRRDEEFFLNRERTKQLVKDAKIDSNAEARQHRDKLRKRNERLASAAARGIPLRHRTDCSKMTPEQKLMHRREKERNKPSRRLKSAAASAVRSALSDYELEDLAAGLAALDGPSFNTAVS